MAITRSSRWLAWASVVALGASVLAPSANAQTFEPPPKPTSTVQTLEVYPHVDTVAGKQLKTVFTSKGKEVVADRLIVVFNKGADQNDANLRVGARSVKQLGPNTQLVDVSSAKTLDAAINAYRADARVKLAAPDALMIPAETPNDSRFGSQWNMTRIQAPEAWNRSHGSTARRIAILDSGIDETHADLSGRVVARRDFTGSPSGTADMVGHGTHVAGIAGAVTNNGAGVAGAAWNTSLLNGKVFDDAGNGSLSMLIDGIRWSVANGADVINMSLGSKAGDDCVPSALEDLFDYGVNELQDAIGEAWGAGVVLVASAGNSNTSNQQWPGACPNVLSVANTTTTDTRASDSNFGTWVDVAAPGEGILSTIPGGGFGNKSGTSMASPLVAGLAALVKTSCGFNTPSLTVSRIQNTADAITGTGTLWQFGRVNALKAVCFPAPSNMHLGTVGSNSIEILWTDGGAPADSYTEVYFRRHNAATWTAQVLAANRTSWLHQGLSAGQSWDYKVRDCDANGCSAFSNMVTGFVAGTGYTLTVTRHGTGTVSSVPAGISCGSDCSDTFASGSVVTLEAVDGMVGGAEWVFTGWSGACTGHTYTCNVTMNAAKSVTATFRRTGE